MGHNWSFTPVFPTNHPQPQLGFTGPIELNVIENNNPLDHAEDHNNLCDTDPPLDRIDSPHHHNNDTDSPPHHNNDTYSPHHHNNDTDSPPQIPSNGQIIIPTGDEHLHHNQSAD